MAHWAELDDENKVIRITVGNNDEPDEGYQWLIDNLGGRWLKTSFNSHGGVHYLPSDQLDEDGCRIPSGQPHFRFNHARVGGIYDENLDAFIAPKPTHVIPGAEWVLNTSTCLWELVPIE